MGDEGKAVGGVSPAALLLEPRLLVSCQGITATKLGSVFLIFAL
jgi:hypothetical protein